MTASGQDAPPHVLILVQNLSVPFDRRVWQESRALHDAGYLVSIICPSSTRDRRRHEVLDGIAVYRYPPVVEARRPIGYLVEYAVALLAMTLLALRINARRRVQVVHVCNPPDLLFVPALPVLLLARARLVFDHHDVSPELLVAKGHPSTGAIVRFARICERLTFGFASVSIATNESYRDVARSRGGMAAADVFVVRSGPETAFGHPAAAHPLKESAGKLVAYVGVMGAQEGIDYLLDAADLIVNGYGRDDVVFALAGSGPETRRLQARVAELELDAHVIFLGRIPDEELVALLSSADVCVNPDEFNCMNDVSTMNKVLEYMALGRPIVQFDLHEGRVSAGDAALYAAPNDRTSFADAICTLLDDERLREEMGRRGRVRFLTELAWSFQVPHLLAAYERVLKRRRGDINLLKRRWWAESRRVLTAPVGVAREVPVRSDVPAVVSTPGTDLAV